VSHYFAPTVYLLCFVASVICAAMLARSFHRTHARLLFWSAACFFLLAGNNLVLVIDLVVVPKGIDLSVVRQLLSVAAVSTLLYGFIWNVEGE
jgi:hypothetical protein